MVSLIRKCGRRVKEEYLRTTDFQQAKKNIVTFLRRLSFLLLLSFPIVEAYLLRLFATIFDHFHFHIFLVFSHTRILFGFLSFFVSVSVKI